MAMSGPQPGPEQASPAPQPKLVLLTASQPDIVRSVQKDDMYQQQAIENLYEVIRSTCGAFTALQYSREIGLVAQLLYNGLTTGTGMSTLGEEYCNMAQVTGHGHTAPQLTSRAALVLIRSLGPYVTESLLSRFDRQQQEHLDAVDQEPFPWSSTSHAQPAPRSLCDTPSHPSHDGPSWEDSDQDQPRGHVTAAGDNSSNSKQQGASRLDAAKVARRLMRRLHAAPGAARHILLQALTAVKPHIRPALPYLSRLHLALFYLYGAYYMIPHRLAGIRYISIARPLQGRPSYRVLGVLMVIQLLLMAAYQGRQSLLSLAQQAAAARGVRLGAGSTSLKHAVMVEDSRGGQEVGESDGESSLMDWARVNARGSLDVPQGVSSSAAAGGGYEGGQARHRQQQQQHWVEPLVVMSGRPCPLCLGPRKHPTSTPCGHVFCWNCVAQWCNEKPECPLCRSKVLLPQLVPVYHCTHF